MSLAAGNAKNMGIDAVLEEMRRHARSAQLHHYLHAFPHYGEMPVVRSCKALADLARGNAENQGKIGAQGGIELVLEAMRRHAGSANLQGWGCLALASLADGNAENRGKIGAQGGIKVIRDGMQKHKDASGVQTKGLAALRVIDVAQQVVASSAARALNAGAAGKRPSLEKWGCPRCGKGVYAGQPHAFENGAYYHDACLAAGAPKSKMNGEQATPSLSAGAGAAAGSHRSENAETARKVGDHDWCGSGQRQ